MNDPKEKPLPNQPERNIPTKPDQDPDPTKRMPEKVDPTRIPDPAKNDPDPTRINPTPNQPKQL